MNVISCRILYRMKDKVIICELLHGPKHHNPHMLTRDAFALPILFAL